MAVDTPRASRLLYADLLSLDGFEFWDTVVLPPATARPDDIIYTVLANDRIDLIAQKFYRDPIMWWIIAWANDMEILPTDLKVGVEIRIPSLDFVQTQLLEGRAR